MTPVSGWTTTRLPLPDTIVDLAAAARLVVTLEDGVRVGGVGDAVGAMLRDGGVDVPLQVVGVPDRFLTHGKRAQVLAECGLTAQEISRGIVETMARCADPLDAQDETSQSTTSVADQPLG